MGKPNAKYQRAVSRNDAACPSLKTRLIGCAAAASLMMFGLCIGNVAHVHTQVTLEVDGVSRPVTAWGNTSAAVLNAAGVEVAEKDVVFPQLDQTVHDGDTVVVRTAHPFEVNIDGQQRTIWSTSNSVDTVLADLAVTSTVTMPADRSATRTRLLPLVATNRAVSVKVGGVEQ